MDIYRYVYICICIFIAGPSARNSGDGYQFLTSVKSAMLKLTIYLVHIVFSYQLFPSLIHVLFMVTEVHKYMKSE